MMAQREQAVAAVHRPTPWVAYSTSEWRWVARWLRAVKGKLAALIASLTLRDPGQPFATVLTGLYDLLLRSPS